jgi:hypothetical protein
MMSVHKLKIVMVPEIRDIFGSTRLDSISTRDTLWPKTRIYIKQLIIFFLLSYFYLRVLLIPISISMFESACE